MNKITATNPYELLNALTMKSMFFSLLLSCSIFTSYGQLRIGSGATLSTGTVTVSTNSAVVNEGNGSWNAGSILYLNGSGSIASTNPWSLSTLKLDGEYALEGTVIVLQNFELMQGHITPAVDANLIVASGGNITSQNEAHINGKLFHEGTGEKFYPVGKNSIYTPVTLTDIEGSPDVMVGIEAFNENLNLQNFPAGIGSASTSWYWAITSSGLFDGSPLQIPLTAADMSAITADRGPAILQANGGATDALDLGRIESMDLNPIFISSQEKALGPYILLGFESEAQPIIHNIITPSLEDGKNDHLFIENFEPFEDENLVILLDRWGTEICRIINFRNDPTLQQGCDLSKLPAGNYICVVEYGNKRLPPTMITIIK